MAGEIGIPEKSYLVVKEAVAPAPKAKTEIDTESAKSFVDAGYQVVFVRKEPSPALKFGAALALLLFIIYGRK